MRSRRSLSARNAPIQFALPLVLLGCLCVPCAAVAQSVGWELAPAGAYVGWDDGLGLTDGWVWGGGLGLTFGDWVRLRPFYLRRAGLDADPAAIAGAPFPEAAAFELDVHHVGTALELGLGRGSAQPFVHVAGGVLRFDPTEESREDLTRLTLAYGGGFRLGVGSASLEVWGERLDFRLDRSHLYAGGAPLEEGDEEAWENVAGGVSLQIPLGGRPEPDPATGLMGAAAPVEVTGGRLDFDDAFGLGEQNLAALSLGFDVNRLAGVRGFYAWGVNDDWDGTETLRAYGGEARFRLGGTGGLAPFVVAGAARLDFQEPAAGEPSVPGDRTALILGGGLALPLSDRLDLTVSARDWLMNPGAEGIGSTDDPDELTSNWLWSAGLAYRLGGAGRGGTAVPAGRPGAVVAATAPGRAVADTSRVIVWDTVRVVDEGGRVETRLVPAEPGAQGPRTLVLPVLDEGTIFIRFGPGEGVPGGATGALVADGDLRALVREELRAAGGDLAGADLDRLEDRIVERLGTRLGAGAQAGISPEVLERIDAIEARLARRIDALVEERLARADAAPEGPPPGGPERAPSAFERLRRWQSDATVPYGGLGLGGDTQIVLGSRFDFGRLSPGHPLLFVPELAVGVGEGTPSFLVLANFHYRFGGTRGARDFQPYLTGGAGVFSPTVLALQTGAGVSFDLRAGRDAPLRAFVEAQGLNLFSRTRLLFGVTLAR